MQRHSGGPPPGPRWLRLLGLGGAVVCVITLPLAMASAGPVGDERPAAERRDVAPGTAAGRAGRPSATPGTDAPGRLSAAPGKDAPGRLSATPGPDAKAPSAEPSRTPLLLGIGVATAARCGPEVTSPDGVEAQTCVLTQGADTWARTYYRNATGGALAAVLSFMGPGGRTVQMRCAVGADDEPGTCETPRERGRGGPGEYTAVVEFARAAGDGPLMLRSGSNSPAGTSG
ncbi:hypothetical protein P1P75_30090 [Streptomyces sp. ID05-39B]|uniref:hypothetical protein n=1 Tax=Streptomyces sp. ID05-39B TaxID=3028664 RepID=UPI0029B6A9D5|nr:hypothetical protein [Streptomyces sp. ID05-39B]MDX3530547.1 hypothetical protein [Streptomyces sp. ID05-39B]